MATIPPALFGSRAVALILSVLSPPLLHAAELQVTVSVDPVSRYPRISYRLPDSTPPEAHFRLSYRQGDGKWQPAPLLPQLSHAALRLMPAAVKEGWQRGEQTELRASGQQRIYYWTPYGHLPADGSQSYTLRGELEDKNRKHLGAFEVNVTLDNRDIRVLSDLAPLVNGRKGVQITPDQRANGGRAASLTWTTSQEAEPPDAIHLGPPEAGRYAIYLSGDSQGWIGINGGPLRRLRPEAHASESALGIYSLKPDSLRALPLPTGTGAAPLILEGLRFVPVSEEESFTPLPVPEKLVFGYFEPYSWSFWRMVRGDTDYRDVVQIYKDAGIHLIDTQYGRFGARMIYETEAFREERFNAAETQGDQGGKKGVRSRSLKAWSMLANSRPLAGMKKAADEAGIMLHANFGATNAYPGMAALQSEFSKNHPELHRKRGNFLALGESKVQEYMLGIYRESLEMGAPGISIDFCRYPHGADNEEQVTTFLRRLRALADEFTPRRTLLVRFPATGERRSAQYHYQTWIKEELVDFLCPSNIFSTVLHFDVSPYIAAAKGSSCKVLPVIDMIPAGAFRFVEPTLLRAREIYQAGADGIYLYQPDAHLFYFSPLTRAISLLQSPEAIEQELRAIAARRESASKSLLIEPPSHAFLGGYRMNNERVRFWLEGSIGPELEILQGNEVIHHCASYPYVFGEEATDAAPPTNLGKQRLRVRARDGNGWLEEFFDLTLVAPHHWD